MADVREVPIFYTEYIRPKSDAEINSGEKKVETAGYIPAEIQIEDMIMAGQRLNQARAERFDFPDGRDDDLFMDPTRSPNFDLADASSLANMVDGRLSKAEAEMEAKRKEAAEKKKAEDDELIELGRQAKAEKKNDLNP